MNKRIKYIIIAILVIVGIVLFYKNVYIVKTTYKTLSPKVANLDIKEPLADYKKQPVI